MESSGDLRLKESDKIQKTNFLNKIFKKESEITQENLEFLEEHASHATMHNQPNQTSQLESLPKDSTSLDSISSNSTANQESPNITLDTQEKEELNELSIDEPTKEIPFKMVCITFGVMFFVLLLFIPKIYIRNNIYYTSRNIVQLQTQLDSLNEENKQIKKQLEDIKFRNLTHELDF